MKKITCPRCNAELYPDSVKCYSCGLILKQQLSDSITIETGEFARQAGVRHIGNPICPNCYVPLFPDSIKCFSCGYALPKEKVYVDDFIRRYVLIRNSITIPELSNLVTYKDSSNSCPIKLDVTDYPILVWKEKNSLYFFPFVAENIPSEIIEMSEEYPDIFANYARLINNIIEPFSENFPDNENYPLSIPISYIEYFERTGEVFRESKISGGGGGGVSILGAIIGGVIAGGAGAIIGSRQRINPIKSELVTHDERVTNLKFTDEYRNRHTIYFGADAFEEFNDLIPEKEYSFVMANRKSERPTEGPKEIPEKSVVDLIREFAQLKEEGIITEEEFEAKKKQLLGI